MPKRQYNRLKRNSQHSHMSLSRYVRRELSPKKTQVFEPKDDNNIIESNAVMDKKIDDLKGLPWRALENLNRCIHYLNIGKIPNRLGTTIYDTRDEVGKLERMIEDLKR